MVMLVTLQQASDHLRRDTGDDDDDLIGIIHAASNSVLNYLKKTGVAYEYEVDSSGDIEFDTSGRPIYQLDSSGDLVPLPEVQSAVLLMIGVLYTDRSAQKYVQGTRDSLNPTLGNFSMPLAVQWLLQPLRKPTLA